MSGGDVTESGVRGANGDGIGGGSAHGSRTKIDFGNQYDGY